MIDKFLNFEKEEKLFEYTYDNIYYWHLIRMSIYEMTKLKFGGAGHPDIIEKCIFEKLKFLPYYLQHIVMPKNRKENDVFVIARYRPILINGKKVIPLVDDVRYSSDFSTFTHFIHSKKTWKEAKYNEKEGSNIVLRWKIGKRFIRKRYELYFNKELQIKSERLSNIINDTFNTEIPCKLMAKQIIGAIEYFKCAKKYYIKELATSKCKCAYIINHAGPEQMAFIAACRELDIPAIEQQHGTIGSQHIAYNFGDLRPVGKYLPDMLFTFGEYWTKTCRMPEMVKRVSIGSSFLDGEKIRLSECTRNEKAVVFYSQGPIGAKLSRLALDFATLAVKQGYKVYYKLHPNERLSWRSIYPWLDGQEVMEIADQPVSVYEFMAQARFHVGVHSTSLFEALAFSGTVFVADLPGSEYMDDMVNMGFAVRFAAAEELLVLIEDYAQTNKEDTDEIGEKLYLPGAAQRLEDMLCKLIREGK